MAKNFVCFFCCLAKKIPESKCLNLQDLYQSSWKKFNYFYLSFLSYVCLRLYNSKKVVFLRPWCLYTQYLLVPGKNNHKDRILWIYFLFFTEFSPSQLQRSRQKQSQRRLLSASHSLHPSLMWPLLLRS